MRKFAALLFMCAVSVNASDRSASQNLKWLKALPMVKELNCSAFKDDTYSGDFNRNELEIKKSVFRKTPLFEGGAQTCSLSQDSGRLKQPEVSVSEKAKLAGVAVEIYHSDGSGMVGNEYNDPKTWFSKCSSDAMTDEVRCSVYQRDFALVRTKNGYEVVVGSSNYPGSKAMLRFGKETPFIATNESTFSHKQTEKIIEKLSSDSPVTTRHTNWPNGNNQDNNLNTKYFTAAKQLLDAIFENHI